MDGTRIAQLFLVISLVCFAPAHFTHAMEKAMTREQENFEIIRKYPAEFPEQQASMQRTQLASDVQPVVVISVPRGTAQDSLPTGSLEGLGLKVAPPKGAHPESALSQTAAQAYGSFHAARANQSGRNQQIRLCTQLVTTDERLFKAFQSNDSRMVGEVYTVAGLLQKCKSGLNTPESMQAIFMLSQLRVGLSSYEYNEAFQKALLSFYNLVYNQDGSLKLDRPASFYAQAIDTILQNFNTELQLRKTEHENDLMIAIVGLAQGKSINRDMSILALQNEEWQNKISMHAFNKDLISLISACSGGKWEDAHAVIDRYAKSGEANGRAQAEHVLLHELYTAFSKSTFNEYGVAHAYGLDPYLQECILEKTSVPDRELNSLLEQRDKLYHSILEHFSLASATGKVREVAYKLVDVADEQPEIVADYLAHLLSKDSKDAKEKAVYDTFYESNGLLKGYTYSPTALQGFKIPDTVSAEAHASERSLLFRFANYNTYGKADLEEGVRAGISYVVEACSDTAYAQSCRSLAQATDKALLDERVDSTILRCQNLALSCGQAEALSASDLDFVVKIVDTLQNSPRLSAGERISLQAGLLGYDTLAGVALQGKTALSDAEWNALKPILALPGTLPLVLPRPEMTEIQLLQNLRQGIIADMAPDAAAILDRATKLHEAQQSATVDRAFQIAQAVRVVSGIARIAAALGERNWVEAGKASYDLLSVERDYSMYRGNSIKEFPRGSINDSHIFSRDHIKRGIMDLGSSRNDILCKFRDEIIKADKLKLLKEGDNQIHTIFNGHKVIIRCRLLNGRIQKVDGFRGQTTHLYGNRIRFDL